MIIKALRKIFVSYGAGGFVIRFVFSIVFFIVLLGFIPENSSLGDILLVSLLLYWALIIAFFIVFRKTKQSTSKFKPSEEVKNIEIPSKEEKIEVIDKPKTSSLLIEANKTGVIEPKFEVLKKHLKEKDVLYPDDNFYAQWDGSDDALRIMASKIFSYLGVLPKELFVAFYSDMDFPGLYVPAKGGESHGILINSKHRDNPFQCGAILAHEIMHYFLIGKKRIHLEDNHENELLTDLATIQAGLGILILNGFYHYSGWHETIIALSFGMIRTHEEQISFGYFKPQDYARHLDQYLKKTDLNLGKIYRYVLPHARYFIPSSSKLNLASSARIERPEYIKRAEKLSSRDFFKRIGSIVLLVPIGLIYLSLRFGGVGMVQDFFSKTKSVEDLTPAQQQEVSQLKSSIEEDKNKLDLCEKDLNNLQSNIDSIESQMASYDRSGAYTMYNSLVSKQNSLANEYNSKKGECNKILDENNSEIDKYNSIIKK